MRDVIMTNFLDLFAADLRMNRLLNSQSAETGYFTPKNMLSVKDDEFYDRWMTKYQKEQTMKIDKAEYFELKCAALKLQLLEEAGVDNWEGYGDALSSYFRDKSYNDLCEEIKKEIDEL